MKDERLKQSLHGQTCLGLLLAIISLNIDLGLWSCCVLAYSDLT